MAVGLNIVNDLIQLRKCKTDIAVRASVIERDLVGNRIVDRRTREAYVWNKAPLLIPLLRSQQEVLASIKNLGRIVYVEDRAAD